MASLLQLRDAIALNGSAEASQLSRQLQKLSRRPSAL
ncbi:putative ferrous iron transport protein C [Yersinia pestis Angola]|nr:putative ferrous iron transport protein C [Yersinia pestis Angola]